MIDLLHINLCQKLLFLHQLTHNMTTDCSWNYHEKYKCRTWAEHVLPMFCQFSALVVFMVIQSFVILWISWCKNKCFRKRFTCTSILLAWWSDYSWFIISYIIPKIFVHTLQTQATPHKLSNMNNLRKGK